MAGPYRELAPLRTGVPFGFLIFTPLALAINKRSPSSLTTTDVGYQPVQPVPYSHKLHVGDLGLDPRKCAKPTVICIVDTIRLWPQDRYDHGLTCLTAATPISHRENLSPRIKSLNYLAHILAKIEGIAANVDEVVMLDASGYVTEASGMNLFAVSNHTLRTPPPWSGILRGVTRDAVMELARDAGYAVEETPLNRYDLYTADEVFLTGTAAEVVGITRLDGRTIGAGTAGPVTKDMALRFHALATSGD